MGMYSSSLTQLCIHVNLHMHCYLRRHLGRGCEAEIDGVDTDVGSTFIVVKSLFICCLCIKMAELV